MKSIKISDEVFSSLHGIQRPRESLSAVVERLIGFQRATFITARGLHQWAAAVILEGEKAGPVSPEDRYQLTEQGYRYAGIYKGPFHGEEGES